MLNVQFVFLVLYSLFGVVTLIYYLNDFRDVKFDISKLTVSLIALFLPPVFWLLRAVIKASF